MYTYIPKMRTIKRRFKDSFKAKGEAIGPMFLRNAENTLTFPDFVH